jgi:putative protease
MNRSTLPMTGMTLPVSQRPELLAPAGDGDCLRAAVANGADAVYFGLASGFNARARATNFDLETLPETIAFLHRHEVRGYVTLNTLAFTDELEALEGTICDVAAAGTDAVLVQDLGVVRLIREVCPDLPIHASTQMTLTSAECIEVARSLGAQRVVLARELSIKEIAQIARGTSMPLEVFVHGALCVAYSGQCLTSESLGGRSANRGQCAQACRLPYELVCDGRDVELGDVKYLLSPQDLAAYALVPELIAAGVCAFKIEGRLKTPEYVANITRHYRRAIDTALTGQPVEFTPRDVEQMELSFSRGFSPGWLGGCDHKMLVPGLSSAKRGVLLGRVCEVRRGRVAVELSAEVKRGDGVVFEGDRAARQEQGGRVFEVFRGRQSLTEPVASGVVELAFGRDSLDLARLRPGQQVWKTDDPQLTARWRKTFAGSRQPGGVAVDVSVRAAVGEVLRIDARTAGGATCTVASEGPLAAAVRHPLTEDLLREQLGRLGGTPFVLRAVEATIDGTPMAPLSVLGKLRHAMVERLEAMLVRPRSRRIAAPRKGTPRKGVGSRFSGDDGLRLDHGLSATKSTPDPVAPQLHVLCRSLAQLSTVLGVGARSVVVDFQHIREYGQAVRVSHDADATILIATPRIQKPAEMGIFRVLLRHGADGILARNLAGLKFFAGQGVPVITDFSLNAANPLTVDCLRELGARRVTASYDMNRDQLLGLAAAVPAQWLEVVVHQHMPMFHMEHCVFCAVLSPGTNKTNCGRPCDRHEVQLRDRIGMEHPLRADVGCRNTLFNAVPQSGAEAVPALRKAGVRHFRIELLHDEPAETIAATIELYQELLAGRLRGDEVWGRLRASNRVGVTRGTLEERRNPLAIL